MSFLTRLVAKVADEEGLWAQDVARHPDLLEKHGLDAEDVESVASQANHYNTSQLVALCERYGATYQLWGASRMELPRQDPPDSIQDLEEETTTPPRGKLFGHPVTAVIRWMGKQGWTPAMASAALEEMGVAVAEATIKAQLNAGRKGKRGEPANLTKAQAAILLLAAT